MKNKLKKRVYTANIGTTTTTINRHSASYYLAGVIVLLTFAIYLPALKNGFVAGWDDGLYILENTHVHSLGLKFFRWAFTDTTVAMYWHPLTWLSHAVDYSLWGLNPLGHHLTSIIFHSINTAIVVWMTICLLTVANDTRVNEQCSLLSMRDMLITAAITGLLFGIHPLHVESVAWIAQRKDLLYSLFYMLSIISYIRYSQKLGSQTSDFGCSHYYGALAFFILALFSKPMAVTLPAILLLLDWYPLKRTHTWKHTAALFVEKLPFLAFSAAASAIAVMAQKTGSMKPLEALPATTRLLVACRGLMLYLLEIIAPLNLLPLHPYPKDISLTKPIYVAAIVIIGMITILSVSVFILRKRQIWLAVWGFFVASVLPVIGLFQHAGDQYMADRYIYLASYGPFLLIGIGVTRLWKKIEDRYFKWHGIKLLAAIMVISIVALLTILTVRQIAIWQNPISLWNYFIEKKPAFREGYYWRGEAFGRNNEFIKAIDDYSSALKIDPGYGSAYINRASMYFETGQFDMAFADTTKAIAVEPNAADAYTIRGNIYYKKGEFDQAIAEYSIAVTKKPTFHQAYLNRAVTYRDHGDIDNAITDFSTTLALAADSMHNVASVYIGRGDLYLKKGIMDLAAKDYQKACELGSKTACSRAISPLKKQ